jgi:hypothetical protein
MSLPAGATIRVLPAVVNYVPYRGDDFADVVTIEEGDPSAPADVSDRVYTAQLRREPDGPVVVDFDIDMGDAASGDVGYAIPQATMQTLRGCYTWDFQQSLDGVVRTLMGGTFQVRLDTTKAV